ncbi:RagB/SusD family nutrient uptake outer membrane protein [Chitinophaga alhagiae]|uniref:RagB/SusD family nutrient uptake outer membrane protein n=1 Tax=Chitinophaga alhagiae TaxID=2203219 RepID=UPI000E5A5060|nr:RagB/SusD family nutrient uptake outer membrane protein [Chitinophaga alhagiae]
MKLFYHIGIILTLLVCSCNDGFLDKRPLNQISQPEFWKTTGDLEVYLNNLYGSLPQWGSHDAGPYWADNNSDNMVPGLYNLRLAGLSILPVTGGGWNWGNIRAVNLFLEQAPAVTDGADKDHFLGEGYFFRAWFYFELLQQFGDLPWIDKPLATNSPELYNERQPRNVIADNILKDLDQAITLLKDKETAPLFRVNRSVALAFKSRVALYEGTWEKYHQGTPYGAQGANPAKYLEQAAAAAKTMIDEKKFAVYDQGHPEKDYSLLFNQSDLSGNSEVIFWRKYKLGVASHNGQRYLSILAGNTGISASLVQSYLCTDGKPVSLSPYYQGDNGLSNVVKNRDPRLRQLIFVPGDPITIDYSGGGDTLSKFQRAAVNLGGDSRDVTGYQIKKGAYPDKTLQQGDFMSTTAPIIFRLGEVLLNYAEAKAELGTLTQADLDASINLLRSRVGMPPLVMTAIEADPAWDFPGLSGIINEVRRERRVELACEGFRLQDLLRWRAHTLLVNKRPKGAKFISADYPAGTDVPLDAAGYIDPYKLSLVNGYQFKPERDYLLPLPAYELSLNEKLAQNPGWPRK